MNAYLFVVLSALVLFSCNNSVDQKQNAVTKVNDVAVASDQCGKNDTTLLFVHGWCISKEYWNDQSRYFCDKYKIVTLDLPGFGRSGKNRADWAFVTAFCL